MRARETLTGPMEVSLATGGSETMPEPGPLTWGSSRWPSRAWSPTRSAWTSQPTKSALTGLIEVATGRSVLTATEEGVLFELVVPPEAFIGDQEASIAPASVTSLPTAAGAVAAVDLQPDGLIFEKQATLRITVPPGLPNAPSDGALVGFGWSAEGADFHMRPLRTPSAIVIERARGPRKLVGPPKRPGKSWSRSRSSNMKLPSS